MTFEARNLDPPDETRKFEHGEIRIVNVSGATVGRAVFNPGWKWSNDVKPLAGPASSPPPPTADVIWGWIDGVMGDGTGGDAGPGDAIVISPGHDAWIVGDEPCVVL